MMDILEMIEEIKRNFGVDPDDEWVDSGVFSQIIDEISNLIESKED